MSCADKARAPSEVKPPALDLNALRAGLETYAAIALAVYDDSLARAEQLLARNRALVAHPSAESLAEAQAAWLRARTPYAQSEVFRFYDGPIDRRELWINSWPIDEAFVESAPADTSAGIVQDRARYPELTGELLTRLNGEAGETAISTGYHVIEFLLWGRDDNESGPGQRSYRDFVVPERKSGDAELVQRRGSYLLLASQLLVAHLREVRDAWRNDQPGNYRASFFALPPPQALALALKGMAKLSGPELSGERLTVAYETKNQENEHSCFSDSTREDLRANALGIENVCLGRYVRSGGEQLVGMGLCAALKTSRPELAARLTAEVRESARLVAAIPAPFERAIQGDDEAPGRRAIAQAIRSLRAQATTLDQLHRALAPSEPVARAQGAP